MYTYLTEIYPLLEILKLLHIIIMKTSGYNPEEDEWDLKESNLIGTVFETKEENTKHKTSYA
jgi:hypothetical protein